MRMQYIRWGRMVVVVYGLPALSTHRHERGSNSQL